MLNDSYAPERRQEICFGGWGGGSEVTTVNASKSSAPPSEGPSPLLLLDPFLSPSLILPLPLPPAFILVAFGFFLMCRLSWLWRLADDDLEGFWVACHKAGCQVLRTSSVQGHVLFLAGSAGARALRNWVLLKEARPVVLRPISTGA